MTEQELNRIAKLAERASGGQWGAYGPGVIGVSTMTDVHSGLTIVPQRFASDMDSQAEIDQAVADVEFIAAARSAVPALVDEVHSLQAWCAAFALDSEAYDAGVRAGVAKSLAQADRLFRQYQQSYDDKPNDLVLHGIKLAFDGLKTVILGNCGPGATIPPHEKVIAENDRLRRALRSMLACWYGGEVSPEWKSKTTGQIAAEALGES